MYHAACVQYTKIALDFPYLVFEGSQLFLVMCCRVFKGRKDEKENNFIVLLHWTWFNNKTAVGQYLKEFNISFSFYLLSMECIATPEIKSNLKKYINDD